MSKTRTEAVGKEAHKEKDVWKIEGLVARIEQLIGKGLLKSKGGSRHIYDVIRKEFESELADRSYNFNQRKFGKKLMELVWSKVIRPMKNAARSRMDPERVYPEISYIPHRLFMRKWNEIKGKGSRHKKAAPFVRGILRLSADIGKMSGEPVDFKTGTYKHPFEAKLGSGGKVPQFLVLNGVNLGVAYSGVMEENPAIQALLNAEHRHDDFVVLTNYLDIDTVKSSGPLKVLRALLSGRTNDPASFDQSYSEEVKRIISDKPHGELVYQTFAEAFVDTMRGWAKIISVSKFSPKKPIYIILGYQDEQLISAAAYWEAHYFTRLKENELEIRKSLVCKQLSLLKNAKAVRRTTEFDDEIEFLAAKLEDLENELTRTRMTNVTASDWKRYRAKVLRFVIKALEATFPNAEVIGIGTSFLKVSDKIGEFNIPRDNEPSDELLANYCQSYGPKVLSGRMANFVVICHPFALNHRAGLREVDKDGVRGSAPIYVAPILVDERFIRTTLRDTVRLVHPLARAVKNPQFKAGMLRLSLINGMLQPEVLTVDALQALAKKAGKKRAPNPKYIWVQISTDPHYGSQAREILVSPEGRLYGVTEATMGLMRSSGLLDSKGFPIHMFAVLDDPSQGNHFGVHQQPHPQKMSYLGIEDKVQEALEKARKSGDPEELRRAAEEIASFTLRQFWIRGELWTYDQMLQVIDRLIRKNSDFLAAVLKRTRRSGLIIKGLSAYNGAVEDRRDIGAINWGTGNHIVKSTNREVVEGGIYAAVSRERLRAETDFSEEELKRLVKSPLYSNQNIGQGVIQAPGGCEWALDLRDTPPGPINWNDPLLGVVRNDLQRGDYSRIQAGRPFFKAYGDKHMFGTVVSPNGVYHISASDTHTDQFGELGFPPNNTGTSFVGLPAEGPAAAPILYRFFPVDHLKRFFENGLEFDWESFLPNPV